MNDIHHRIHEPVINISNGRHHGLRGTGACLWQPRAGVEPALIASPGAFLAPLIETVTDMENLLAIDPVHEVDGQGWPQTPALA